MMINILKWPVIFIMTIISYVLEAILKIGCYIAAPALILSVIGIFVSLLNEMWVQLEIFGIVTFIVIALLLLLGYVHMIVQICMEKLEK